MENCVRGCTRLIDAILDTRIWLNLIRQSLTNHTRYARDKELIT